MVGRVTWVESGTRADRRSSRSHVRGHEQGDGKQGDKNGALTVATNSNFVEPTRIYDRGTYPDLSTHLVDPEDGMGSAFISQRGLILISCFVYCAMFWSIAFLWLFG
jgi:hypothetical protein